MSDIRVVGWAEVMKKLSGASTLLFGGLLDIHSYWSFKIPLISFPSSMYEPLVSGEPFLGVVVNLVNAKIF